MARHAGTLHRTVRSYSSSATTMQELTFMRCTRTRRILPPNGLALRPLCGATLRLVGQRRRTTGLGVAFMLVTLVLVMTAGAWQPFVATDLGALGNGSSFALDISETGVAIGYSGSDAFRWTQAEGMVDLGTLGGGSSVAWAVNDWGTVAVGASMTAENTQHAFVWTETARIVDLGTLGRISAGSYATGVNDSALVVGFSWYKMSEDYFAGHVTRG